MLPVCLLACLCLFAFPVTGAAQEEESCQPLDTAYLQKQLKSRNYAVFCIPSEFSLLDVREDVWLHVPPQRGVGQAVQRELFSFQVRSGQFDAYVVGSQPPWQTSGPLRWERDFAAMGPRGGDSDETADGWLFVVGMWLRDPLDVAAYADALRASSDQYERIELETLYVRYLDGESPLPPQTAYVLDGAQMQQLFQLDSVFLNNQYVVLEPDPAQPVAGLPVLTFFSSMPISTTEMTPLLEGLLFRPAPLPSSPSVEQVTDIRASTGLLALVPELDKLARARVARAASEIESLALEFAAEFSFSFLLPFRLLTSDTDLYWAPGGWRTGRLLLWNYTGGAHGNYTVDSWTVDETGRQLSLADVLSLDEQDALAAVVEAAVEHRVIHDGSGLSRDEIERQIRTDIPDLQSVSAWNPVIHRGRTGLWITMLPYAIASWAEGVQEFFVPMPLTAAE